MYPKSDCLMEKTGNIERDLQGSSVRTMSWVQPSCLIRVNFDLAGNLTAFNVYPARVVPVILLCFVFASFDIHPKKRDNRPMNGGLFMQRIGIQREIS